MARKINTYNYISNNSKLELLSLALYWAEGAKYRKRVDLTNTDPKMIEIFSKFLLTNCNIDPLKLKGRLQIHDKNQIESALLFWEKVSKVPHNSIVVSIKPSKKSNRTNFHENGIFSIRYNSVGLKEIISNRIEDIKCLFF